jgi:geranylgeranyl pyrophosphate synthase
MNSSSIFDLMKDDIRLVETRMRVQVDQDSPDLEAALLHLIQAGGKRIRPMLTLLTGAMLGGNREQIITLAAGIEMLHTATLVHDDLIDGALLRRGIPTLNSRWSPAATVLTGDYLFALAANLIAQSNSLPAMRLFADTLSTIVNGEVTQLFTKGKYREVTQRTDYYRRIHAKTASLFRTSTKVAALVSPVNEEVVTAVGRYGYEIGMAFQIVDDVLDFTGHQVTVGKPLGSDLRQGILTLPAIFYQDMVPDDSDLRAVLEGDCEDGRLERLIEAIRQSGAIYQSLEEARVFADRACAAIAHLPDCYEHKALDDLARFIVERNV